MLVAAYGLPTLSVLEVTYWLEALGISYGVVKQNTLHKVAKPKKHDYTPVVFNSARAYLRTAEKFRSDIIALVTDDAVTLSREYGLPLVGGDLQKDVFTPTPLRNTDLLRLLTPRKEDPIVVERFPYNPIPRILKGYNSSVLSALQTQFYRIKVNDSREEVVIAVRNWLSSRDSVRSLETKLYKLAPEKTVTALLAVITSADFVRFRTAIQETKANPKKLLTIAKKYKISPFDIKYILAQRS
jgi:hypothetical protein